MIYDYDFLVIGGGSGGVRAARIAAQHGAKVALVEQALLGGTCVNVGCVPKKLLVMASHVSDEISDAHGFGWTIDRAQFDWPSLIANKDRELARIRGFYRKGLEQAGATIMEARAQLIGDHVVAVGDQQLTAKYILVATGGRAEKPAGMEHAITSDDAFALPTLPRHVLMYGAGYIALEFAGVFRGLGCDVTLMHRGEQILRGFDRDVRDALAAALTKRGVAIHNGVDVAEVGHLTGTLGIAPDLVLCATGRVPNTKHLGLEAVGVALGARGEVIVDETSRTSVPHLYAVGDCTDRLALTPRGRACGGRHLVRAATATGQSRAGADRGVQSTDRGDRGPLRRSCARAFRRGAHLSNTRASDARHTRRT